MKKWMALLLVVALMFTCICLRAAAAQTETPAEEAPASEAPAEVPAEEATEAPAEGTPYVAVVSKGFQHKFWQTVYQGSLDAAAEYGVEITFEGLPPSPTSPSR